MDSNPLLLVVGLALYLLPTIIGTIRHVPNQGSIGVVNVFLGWTLIGWIVALAMAARTVPVDPITTVRRRPGV